MSRVRTVLPLALLTFLSTVAAAAEQWTAQGVVEPLYDATLGVTASGVVSRILIKEGDSVTARQSLIELRNDLQTLEVERRRLIWQDESTLEEAKQRLATLSEQLSHTQELYTTTQSVAKDELQKEQLQVELARLEVQRLSSAQKQAEVDYKVAQAQLAQRTIFAPFDGVIVKINVDVGDVCNPGQQIVRVVDIAQCRLVVHMDAAASRPLQRGMPARVVITGFGTRQAFDATIDYVAPVADASSGLREIKALFDNPDGRVLPGLTGTLFPR